MILDRNFSSYFKGNPKKDFTTYFINPSFEDLKSVPLPQGETIYQEPDYYSDYTGDIMDAFDGDYDAQWNID